MTLNGKILKITGLDPHKTGHNKKLAKIELLDKSTLWVEFKGWRLSLLERFNVEDMVTVETFTNGQETPSGHHHNNVIAKHIQELELHAH
ncbi:hypothetical protein [Salinimicrobium sp. GXAS 041]|uniref:hypothetical protein n=1 Tax=Salinimicrobium sp. GXAS 041 TaxID=3400806 RepID=UPI003C71DEA3